MFLQIVAQNWVVWPPRLQAGCRPPWSAWDMRRLVLRPGMSWANMVHWSPHLTGRPGTLGPTGLCCRRWRRRRSWPWAWGGHQQCPAQPPGWFPIKTYQKWVKGLNLALKIGGLLYILDMCCEYCLPLFGLPFNFLNGGVDQHSQFNAV